MSGHLHTIRTDADERADWSEIEAFWRDPTPFIAEREAGQARTNALFAVHDAKWRRAQAERWAREEGA